MTLEQFWEIATTLEQVHVQGVDLMRADRHMGRVREKGRAVAMRMTWEQRDAFAATDPNVFFEHPHYVGYPYIGVWLQPLSNELALKVLQASWDAAPLEVPIFKKPKL